MSNWYDSSDSDDESLKIVQEEEEYRPCAPLQQRDMNRGVSKNHHRGMPTIEMQSAAAAAATRGEELKMRHRLALEEARRLSSKKKKKMIALQNASLDYDSVIAPPDLSKIVIKKKKAKARTLGSYAKAVQQTATTAARSPPSAKNSSSIPRKRTTSAIIQQQQQDLLPAPPPYQRVSSNAKRSKQAFQTQPKKRSHSKPLQSSELNDDDTLVQPPPPPAAKPPAANKRRHLKRRYISEAKTNDEDYHYYPDNHDWLSDMCSDVQEAIVIAQQDGIDRFVALDARRYYWKRKSGIYESDFCRLWDKVVQQATVARAESADVISSEPPCSSNVQLEWNVHDKCCSNTAAGRKNKWASLWKEDADIFDFEEWDEKKVRLKPSYL